MAQIILEYISSLNKQIPKQTQCVFFQNYQSYKLFVLIFGTETDQKIAQWKVPSHGRGYQRQKLVLSS